MAGGRKSKYHTHVEPKLLLVEAWARDGLTIDQIADNLGVASSTLFDYKNRYPELSESLKRGQEVADIEVENALFKRALGYQYDEVTQELVRVMGKDGPIMERDEYGNIRYKEELKVVKRVTKEVQPDVTAQIFWLKNRRPDKWRDKKDIDANHMGGLTVVFGDGMTKDE